MHPLRDRLFLTLLTLTCLSFAMARTSVAGRVKFPNNDPTFTLEFPAQWNCEGDKDGNLNCDPGDNSGYVLSLLSLSYIHSQKELKAELPKLAKSMADSAKIKDFLLGKVETSKNGNDVSFTGVTGDGKVEGTDFVVMVHAFEPQKGKFYVIGIAGSAKADKKHDKDYGDITASIEPLE